MKVTIPCTIVSSTPEVRCSSVWSFDVANPIAVTVVFQNGMADEDVEWRFARSLLTEALDPKRGMAGLGDVRFHLQSAPVRGEDDDQGTILRMMVESLEGSAQVEFDALLVAGFLSRTNVLCLGAETYESEAYDWDGFVLELLKDES